MRKNDFYILVPSNLDLWPLDLRFASLVTLVQNRVSTKFLWLLYEKIGRHGTDGETINVMQRIMRPPIGKGPHDKFDHAVANWLCVDNQKVR